MQKQIIYPKFIPRVFAMTIDLVVLSLAVTPVMNFLSKYIFIFMFNDFFAKYGVDTADVDAMSIAMRLPEFAEQITASKFFSYSGLLFLVNTSFMGVYFVALTRKFGATPGKIVMRMKIVNASDHSRPTTVQLIKRFFGYVTALIGIWSIVFSNKGIALHDKLAGTVVIKS